MSNVVRERFRTWRQSATKLDAQRVMHGVAVAACVFFAAVSFWESFGAQRTGHFSGSAAYAMAGENMVHWRKFAMYCDYLLQPARPDQYYCHHPYGIAFLDALTYLVLGHHWFTTRAAAILCSCLSPPLLYGFGKRAWGVVPAAVATVFFIFVPVDISFAAFGNLEVPTIFFGLLFTWGTTRLWDTWRVRYLVAAAVGAFGACNCDWIGLVLVAAVVVFAFVRAYVLPQSFFPGIDERRHAQWFAYVVAAAVGTVVMYLYLFGVADKIADLVGSYHHRSTGSEATLHETFTQRRKQWLSFMLTPISYGALAAGVPLAVLRLVRKPLEIFPIAWAVTASFQYFVFKQGADIHIFWPHYYGPAAAMAAGTLTATLLYGGDAVTGLLDRFDVRGAAARVTRVAVYGAIAIVVAVPLVVLARMGLRQLVQGRKTGGRFDQGGNYMGTDADAGQFVQWALANVATAGSIVESLDKFDFSYSADYAAQRPHVVVSTLTSAKLEDPQRVALLDTRVSPTKELKTIANAFSVQAVGPFWKVDRAQKGPSFTALEYIEKEPNPFEWMFVAGTDLVRTITRHEDPWVTWEWRDALGLPAPAPEGTPTTLEQLRIAHNLAVSEKDTDRANALAAQWRGHTGTKLDIGYSDGVTLRGIDIHQGPAVVTTLFWETDSSFKAFDTSYKVKCKIIKPPKLWFGQTDYFERDMAPVPPIRVAFWKPGYLYAQRFVALTRIGSDECRGSFASDIHAKDAGPDPVIAVFE